MSTTFEVAHFSEQGQQVIVVFVSRSFGQKTTAQQNEICANLQACATDAGLAGTVVPVWDNGGGRTGFLAPRPWHRFFQSVPMATLAANVNRKLTCNW